MVRLQKTLYVMHYYINPKLFPRAEERRIWTAGELEFYERAVTVTALEVLKWADRYSFGNTPWWAWRMQWRFNMTTAPEEITTMLKAVFSAMAEEKEELPFCLFLHHQAPAKGEVCLFDHHDDSCCWVLNITLEQYQTLQRVWSLHSLPTDLFIPTAP